MMVLRCEKKEFQVCAEVADTFFTRFLGLMFRKALPAGTGLLLTRCGRIHMFFMRFPVCAVYLNERHEVLFREELEPGQLGKQVKGAKEVLEVRPEEGSVLSAGDILTKIS